MIISATELHVRSFWKFFSFIRHAMRSRKQAATAPGSLHVWTGNGGWRIGYTFTAWQDKGSMLQYRNSGDHKTAMQQIGRVSRRYRTLTWEADTLPTWEEAKEKLQQIPFKELQ